MTRILVLLAALVTLGYGTCSDDATPRIKSEDARNPFPGYHAEVEVTVGGVTSQGWIIITRDGCVQCEHLDEEARRWASEVIRRASSPSRGWDNRTEPILAEWCSLGRVVALAEIQTANASIKMTRHQPLSSR